MSDWQRFRDRAPRPLTVERGRHLARELQCGALSPASGKRCTREYRHKEQHERRRRSGGVIELWPRVDGDDAQLPAATFAELLDHLDDLIALARVEGFGRIVGVLTRASSELKYGPPGGPRRRRGTRPRLLP
jgi:hypothetical protein